MANPNPKRTNGFKPGNKANPLGSGAHNPVVKAIRQMTNADLATLGALLLEGDIDALRAIKERPGGHSVWKAMIASAAVTAFDRGDMGAMSALMDRIVGKVKEQTEVNQEVKIIIEDFRSRKITDGT